MYGNVGLRLKTKVFGTSVGRSGPQLRANPKPQSLKTQDPQSRKPGQWFWRMSSSCARTGTIATATVTTLINPIATSFDAVHAFLIFPPCHPGCCCSSGCYLKPESITVIPKISIPCPSPQNYRNNECTKDSHTEPTGILCCVALGGGRKVVHKGSGYPAVLA